MKISMYKKYFVGLTLALALLVPSQFASGQETSTDTQNLDGIKETLAEIQNRLENLLEEINQNQTETDGLQSETWTWAGQFLHPHGIEDNGEEFTLDFSSDRVAIGTDCNNGSGEYEVSGDQITFGLIATTKKACGPGTYESIFLEWVMEAERFEVSDGRLTLRISDGSQILFE